MIRLMGITFGILILVVAPIMAVSHISGTLFLDNFMEERSLLLMGTILAIYIAAASSFLSILLNYEKEKGNVIFNNTASEIKQNIIFIIIIFTVHLLLLSATPPSTDDNAILLKILMALKLLMFSFYIFALYELSMVLFGIRSTINSVEKDNKNKQG